MENQARYVVVLLACSIGTIATYSGHTFGFALFLPHLERAVAFDEEDLGGAWALALVASSLALPVFGPLIDRHDVRVVVFCVALCFSAACGLMGYVSNWWELCGGLFAMRLLGPGILVTAMISTMNRWFVAQRGKAFAVFHCLNRLQLCFATPVDRALRNIGWRATYRAVAVIVLLLFTLVSCLIRSSPESSELGRKQPTRRVSVMRIWTRRDALHSSFFWAMLVAVCSVELLWTGVNLHMVKVLEAQDHLSLGQTQMVMAISAMASTMLAGVVIDNLHNKHCLLGVAMLCGMCATQFAQCLETFSSVVGFGVCLGAMAGIGEVCFAMVFADAFGESHVGAIFSVVNACVTLSNAAMAVALGAAADAGRLGVFFRYLTFAMAPIGLLVFCLEKPDRDDVEVHTYTTWSPMPMMWSPAAV